MPRIRLRWAVIGPFVVLLSALAVSQALAAMTFSGVPSGSGVAVTPAWDNGDPALGFGSDNSLSAVSVSDSLAGCFAGQTTGIHLAVYYSRLASGGTAWSKPKQISGAYLADRGTLITSGANVYTAWVKQSQYYDTNCTKYTFDTSQPRPLFFRRNTNNGAAASWATPIKLPGQSATARVDYPTIAASGTMVYVTATDVGTGHIRLWISSDSGVTFATPITIATTAHQDTTPGQTNGACPCGYVGGFAGLPAVATDGSAIGIAYLSSATGAETVAICSTTGTGCKKTVVVASGADANSGYPQAAGDTASGRMAFTWTTATGGFVRIWSGDTTGSFGTANQFATFPDSALASTACQSTTPCNAGGSGAIVGLTGTTGVGIALSECNTVSGVTCDQSQTQEKSREILTWRQSADNGSTWTAPAVIKAPTGGSANTSWMSEFGSVAYSGATPYVLFNGHDDAYKVYDVEVRKCTGC